MYSLVRRIAADAARTDGWAQEAVRPTEAACLEALTRLRRALGDGGDRRPVNRVAALEGIVLTTRAALQEAPADPVINGHHLTARSRREAVLRQISNEENDPWF